MNMPLARLTELLPRPGTAPPAKDWEAVERELGVRLPHDYTSLMATYGGGFIDDYLLLLEPGCGNSVYDLLRHAEERDEAYEELWKYEDKPAEMEEPGNRLIPWATTDNGEYLFWLVRPGRNPDEWTLMINEEGGEEWERHAMTATQFLFRVLSGELRSEVLWSRFPEEVHSFRPALGLQD